MGWNIACFIHKLTRNPLYWVFWRDQMTFNVCGRHPYQKIVTLILNAFLLFYAQCTRTDFLSTTKNRSENRFVCADFCSDIKSLRSFLGVAYDKKSVRVRWLQSEKKSEWRHPTMGPRLLLSHTITPITNRSVCADFWCEKKSVRFFLGAACDKKSIVCADSVRVKIGP